MRTTLAHRPPARFSETAWSRPRPREAGRDGAQVSRPPAIGRRRLADDRAKGTTERSQAREADVEADLGDAAIGLAQEEHRALDPAPLQIAVRRLAEGGAKGADEVRLGDVGDPRQR